MQIQPLQHTATDSDELPRLEALLERMGLPLPLRTRLLGDPADEPVLILAFAVQAGRRGGISRLTGLQQATGSFGSTAATAVVLGALIDAAESAGGVEAPLLAAIDRGMHWLAAQQERSGDAGRVGDEIDSMIVLWQLGPRARSCEALDVRALVDWVFEAGLAAAPFHTIVQQAECGLQGSRGDRVVQRGRRLAA